MTDLGRRGGLPPLGNIRSVEISRMTVFVAAMRTWVGREIRSRTGQLAGLTREWVETIRRILFSDRSASALDYSAPRSEITTFLVSCRRIFWGMAAFSGLSNLLMLTGSFFM